MLKRVPSWRFQLRACLVGCLLSLGLVMLLLWHEVVVESQQTPQSSLCWIVSSADQKLNFSPSWIYSLLAAAMTIHPWTSVSSRFIHSTLKKLTLKPDIMINLIIIHIPVLDINSSNVGNAMWLVMLWVLVLNLLKLLSMILIQATLLMMTPAPLTMS